jgi:hypothetical protein
VCPRNESADVEELECMCSGFEGPAVQGLWSGECGDALTGRKYCWSERGEGMKSRVNIGGTLRSLVDGRGGTTYEDERDCVCVRCERPGCVPAGGEGFSRSEQ